MTRKPPTPLSQSLGERLHVLRQDLGLGQDEVARAARGLGFAWNRTTVAKVEAGRRDLDAAEFLFLPEMLNFAILQRPAPRNRLQAVVELADVLPEDGWVGVTRHNRTFARALRQIARGQLGAVVFTDLDVPILRSVRERAEKALLNLHQVLAGGEEIGRPLGSDGSTVPVARRESAGEAEQKAARKFGIPAPTVALMARRLWGRSLTGEREARVATHTPAAASARQLRALRGHVTRTLLKDLRALLGKDRRRPGHYTAKRPSHKRR